MVKNLLLFSIAFMLLGNTMKAQEMKPEIDFDNIRLTGGNNFSNIKQKEGGVAVGFMTEYAVEKYFMAASGDFLISEKKFSSLTFDIGGGMPAAISKDVDIFIGISTLSINLNKYGGGPLNSAILLKYRYKKLVFETKTTVWNWQQGKDPVFKENAYYGVSYRIAKNLIAGIQYRLYAEDANYLNANFGFMF